MTDLTETWNLRALTGGTQREAMDYEREFCAHLVDLEALKYLLQEGIKDELLYSPIAKTIYAFARTEYERTRKAPTELMLREEFASFNFQEPRTDHRWLAEKLRERYRRAQVQETTRTMAQLSGDPDVAYSYMREKVFEIEQMSGSTQNVWSSADYEHFIDLYQQRVRDRFTLGFTTGFTSVDELSGGVRPAQLVFYLARPKRFKTFFLCKSYVEQRRQGKTPMLATLEMTVEEIEGRVGCILSGLSFDDWDKGRFGKQEWKIWRAAQDEFVALGPAHIVRPPVGERHVTDIFMLADKLEVESVLIDQLSFLEPVNERRVREDLKTAEVVYALKNHAGRTGSERPVICAAQFNREADNLDEIPGAAKAALSGAIEQAADALYGLHRTKEMFENGVVQFGLLESRNAPTGNWSVRVELKEETRIVIEREIL